jgi:hypothetical protein
MREADFETFSGLLDAVCSLLSRGAYVPNATNTALWFRVLAGHDLDTVRAGLDAHVRDPQRGRFVPTPADVIAQFAALAEADGRPGPEEAWALSLAARDEDETVVWTREMADAWFVARPVLALGDEIGARMAFREAYCRLVAEARQRREAPAWAPALGHDASRRVAAISAAVRSGRLDQSELLALAPPPRADVLLLAAPEGDEVGGPTEAVRQRLREVADGVRQFANRPSVTDLDRERTLALKADAARKVAERMSTAGVA